MKVPFADLIEAKQGRIDLDQLGATLAYCHMSGRIAWPVGVIDHINRDRAYNRIVNLRDVTPTENARNKVRKRRSA